MSTADLDIPNAHARYDAADRIAYITYRGYLTAQDSGAVYRWLATLMEEIGSQNVYGEIFDFRQVAEFMPDNLMDARQRSRGLNLRIELDFPVAMIVKDFYQEEILRGPMKNVPENTRKAIVRTLEEAREFMEVWHARQAAKDAENTPETE